jgi:outer membrane protein, adhesin transport system
MTRFLATGFKAFFPAHWAWLPCALALSQAAAAADSEGTLRAVLRESLLRYPAALAARSQVAGAAAELDKATAARWPVVGVGASAYQQSSGTSVRSATPQASYTLYAGGGIEAGVVRAEQLLRSAEGKASSTLDEVAQQAAEAYLMWARALAQKELAVQNHVTLSQITDDVRKIVAVDSGRAVDLGQAEVRVNAAALTVYQRDVDLQQMRARLARYVEALPAQPAGMDDVPLPLPESLEGALAAITNTHPLMLQSVAQLEAAKAGIDMARAQNRPKLDWTVSRQVNPFSMQASNLQQLSVNMPVFNGGAGEANVRSAVEQVQAAQNTLDEQTLVLREKISAAWADWALAQQRVALNQDQSLAGQKLVQNYQLQFRLARRSLLDLLNVQSEAYGYAAAAVQMQYDQRLARFRLSAAMGELARAVKGEP